MKYKFTGLVTLPNMRSTSLRAIESRKGKTRRFMYFRYTDPFHDKLELGKLVQVFFEAPEAVEILESEASNPLGYTQTYIRRTAEFKIIGVNVL